MACSLYRSVYRLGHTDESASLHWSYGRTDGRTDVDRWLSSRDHMSFRNARAHIRISPFGRGLAKAVRAALKTKTAREDPS